MRPEAVATKFTFRSLLPGSIGSLAVHLVILLVASVSLRGCQEAQTGEPGGEVYREIGLFVVDGSDTPSESETGTGRDAMDNPSPSPDVPAVDSTTAQTSQASVLPEQAPDLNQLLNEPNTADGSKAAADLPRVIGPGAPLSSPPRPSGAASALINPSSTAGSQAVGVPKLGPGQTAFMDIADSGRSFVYVIDISASMSEGHRIQMAKSQLKASLRLLQPNQQFQVVFYSEYPMRMKLRRQPGRDMFYATAANILQAVQEVDRVQPEQGTEHLPALSDALSLAPDVIYFLTDGREPQLFAKDLNDLKRLSSSTTIHVIEFGSGALISRETSWLERLARQSNGEYRCVLVGNE